MTCHWAGQFHLCGTGINAAGIAAAVHHSPFTAGNLLNLDDAGAMCRHLDLDQRPCHIPEQPVLGVLPAEAGEHHLFAGIFMVNEKQATIRTLAAERQRQVADEVVIIAELPQLGLR